MCTYNQWSWISSQTDVHFQKAYFTCSWGRLLQAGSLVCPKFSTLFIASHVFQAQGNTIVLTTFDLPAKESQCGGGGGGLIALTQNKPLFSEFTWAYFIRSPKLTSGWARPNPPPSNLSRAQIQQTCILSKMDWGLDVRMNSRCHHYVECLEFNLVV